MTIFIANYDTTIVIGSIYAYIFNHIFSSVPAALEFSQKMVESLLNYTASFAISADQARIKSNETYVPFSAVQNWFTNFERRLQQNPNFWRN